MVDYWFTDGNKQPCEKSQSMTENKEAVVCTQPRSYSGEHNPNCIQPSPELQDHNHDLEVGLCTTLFRYLFPPNDSTPNTPRPSTSTEHKNVRDISTQTNYEPKITGPEKRPHRKCKNHIYIYDSENSERNQQDAYIQIPILVWSGNESTSSPVEVQNGNSKYKLIEGFPSRDEIRKRKSYVMSYNTNTKNANWVYEILNERTLENKCKEQMSFGKNKLNADYQQGHLAAVANHRWCQEAYHDTYLMSNMIPQLSDLNQGMWKTLEEYCRDLAKTGCNVHVYTGPLYLEKRKDDYVPKPNPTNPNNSEEKAVPTHLFKVIIVEKNGTVEKLESYMMPNEKSEYDKKYKNAEKKHYSPKKNPAKHNLLDFYKKSIEKIQMYSKKELKFKIDKPQHNMTYHVEEITWKGEDGNGESCEAKIEVKILKTK